MTGLEKIPARGDVPSAGSVHPEAVQAQKWSPSDPCLVTVMGFDKNDVLFRSDRVGTVQWRDSRGNIAALLVRLRKDVWGFSKSGDDDWPQVLQIYGNPDAK